MCVSGKGSGLQVLTPTRPASGLGDLRQLVSCSTSPSAPSHPHLIPFPPGPPFPPPKALVRLDYPDKLQSLLLTPRREMSVELVVQVGRRGGGGAWGGADDRRSL